MTNSVAAIASAATAADTPRTSAARTSGASFATVQAAAVKSAAANDSSTSADDKKTSVPKGERTQKVDGHNYVEIISGPRNGMFINNTGSKRDGEAFLIVKRHGREFHVYGSGDDRKVYEVGRKRETAGSSGTSGTAGASTSGSDTAATSGATGASTTGAGTTTA